MKVLIDAHDWARTPLGPRQSWPAELRVAVDICLSCPFPSSLWWGPELIGIYNDASIASLGIKHPESLGRPARETWPEVWHVIEPRVEQVRNSREAVRKDDLLFMLDRGRGPEETYQTVSFAPLLGPEGEIAGILVTAVDTTEKVLADRRRAADAERTRRMFEKAPGQIAILRGPEHVLEFANEAYREVAGGRELIGKTARDAFPEFVDQPFVALLDQVYATGERFVARGAPVRLSNVDQGADAEFLLDFIYEPIRDDGGAVTGIFVEGHEVTDRVRAERALQESERRFRAVANLVPDMLWSNDAEGQLNWFNQRWYDYTGMTHATSAGDGWLNAIHPDDRVSALQVLEYTLGSGAPAEHQHRIRRHDGEYRWHLARVEPSCDENGRITGWYGTITDIDDLKRVQQHEHLLLAELQHRVRNMLAIVRGLVARSARHGTSVEDYQLRLDGRLASFARTQSYVARDPGKGVDLRTLISDELGAYGAHEDGQVTIAGPELRLHPTAADKVGLAIHELTTNAVKHGALTDSKGRISVSWALTGPRLLLEWAEHLPEGRIEPPSRRGFGSELLAKALPYELGASVTHEFTPTGIRCVINAPISRLLMSDEITP